VIEQALLLGPRRAIAGVLTKPDSTETSNKIAVLILNAGLIHHAGPGRLHVKLARKLAELGIASVRFDFSGVGDSPARIDNLPIWEVATREPQEVMDDLGRRGFRYFVMAGICSGAYGTFQTAMRDNRVVGGVLINPQEVTGDTTMESKVWSQRYWSNSIFRPKAWLNLFTGKIDYGRLFRTLRQSFVRLVQSPKRDKPETEHIVRAEIKKLIERGASLLFILSDNDVSREYVDVILGSESDSLKATGRLNITTIERTDHLFKHRDRQNEFIQKFCDWLTGIQLNGLQ